MFYLISQTYFLKQVNFQLKFTMLKVLDIFFSTVKPAIPICLYTTLMFSMKRLENAKIHTINRFKINEAGRVDMVCFDKTGTLTEEFPKTFAYGINSVPYNVEFSRPFEELICPPVQQCSNKIHILKKSVTLKAKSDVRAREKSSGFKSNIKRPQPNMSEVMIRRVTQKLSSIGNIYKISNSDRNTSLNINATNALSMFQRNMNRLDLLDSDRDPQVDHKGSIREFCDTVEQVIDDIQYNRMALKYLECMSFCHTLISIDNTYIGDPLEVEMVSNSPFTCRYVSEKNSSRFQKIYVPNSMFNERKSAKSTRLRPNSKCFASSSSRTSLRRCR